MSELAIIGSGIAGITSAIYAKRANLDFSLYEKKLPCGQINYIERIDNFPGTSYGIKGMEFSQILLNQINDLGIKIENKQITGIEKTKTGFRLHTAAEVLEHKAVILASGAAPKNLGIEKEAQFAGRGISYCAVCDGFFFKDKTVAVVGGGNSACEDALYLAGIAKKVYLIHRRDELRAFDYLARQVESKSNIEILWNKIVIEIKGGDFIEEAILQDTKTNIKTTLRINALFVAIGYKPNTQIIRGLADLDYQGFIITDSEMRTSCEGLFAAGDCIKKTVRQLITCAAEGAVAAMSAHSYIKHK